MNKNHNTIIKQSLELCKTVTAMTDDNNNIKMERKIRMTEFRTVAEIGGIEIRPTFAILNGSALIAAYSSVGVVFCTTQVEAVDRTLRWDFIKRAKPAEVESLHRLEESIRRK